MSTKLKTAQEAKAEAVKTGRAIVELAETEKRDFSGEERDALKKSVADAKAAAETIAELEGDEALLAELQEYGDPGIDPGEKREKAADRARGRKTVGERFVESPAWQEYLKNLAPNGEISAKTRVHSPPVGFSGIKDIISGSEADRAGALIDEDFRGLLDGLGAFQQPLNVRNLVTAGTTGSDTVTFARVASTTNNAAPTVEATGAVAAGLGVKPESDMTLEQVTENVRSIPHWLPATKRALADAGQLRTLIDEFLRFGLEETLEDQLINGDGTGENFDGFLNQAGGAQAFDTDLLTTTRRARTLVRIGGRATATAFLFHPTDNETIDLIQDGNDRFYFGGPATGSTDRLWGLPRVETEALPVGTGLVANFRTGVLWDREQATIQASDSHEDFFIRNLVAILAEMRAAFGVIRPDAVVTIDLTP